MERPQTRELPGNDASWYRALLAEDTAATPVPEPMQQVLIADPEAAADNTDPDLVVEPPQLSGDTEPVPFPDEDLPEEETTSPEPEETPDEDPPAEITAERDALVEAVPDPDTEESLSTTSEMVGELWTTQSPASPLDDWEPDAMDRKISSARPFRWTSVIIAVAVLALIGVGLVLLPSLTRDRANNHRDMMVAALWELRAELPDTQGSLQTATEPDSSISALNDLSTQLTVLTAKASAVDAAGRADLPKTPPLTSSQPIDDLVPIQQRLEPLATTASTIQRRIGNLVEYRSLMSDFLALPELPTEADSTTQTDLRVILASAQAQSASILSDLPSDVSLSEHQDQARTLNELFADWQIDYLEALRTQDSATAATLVAELETGLANLDQALITPLAQIRRQTDTDLIDLARDVDEVLSLASGDTPSA